MLARIGRRLGCCGGGSIFALTLDERLIRVVARRVRTGVRALAVVLVIAGLYLLLDHAPPFPLNHEDIGLGDMHLAHSVFGVVALIGAVVLWRRSSRTAAGR